MDRSDRGRLVVSGPDRATYLQGLLTNDVVALAAGRGCYAAYLTPQGRMITDMFVYELGDVMLLSMPGAVKGTVLSKLDQLVFNEEVKLGDVTGSFAQIAVVGPDASIAVAGVLDGVSAAELTALPEHGCARSRFDGQPAIVAAVADTGERGFDIYVERSQADLLGSRLLASGVVALNAETAEAIRIEAGVPLFGRDMDEETIPLEAGIEPRAISFTKGCYVGQEVIIRVLHRGHGRVARKLAGLVLDASLPPPGAPVRAEEREVGHVTSSTMSPGLQRPIALGYLHREYLAPGTSLTIDGARAVVTDLPFVRRNSPT